MGAIVATHRAKGGNRRRGKRTKPKQGKRRRADANGCAKRAKRLASPEPSAKSQEPKASGSRPSALDSPVAKRCAECRRRRLWLRRGLCWACYADPVIRGRHFDLCRWAHSPDMRDAVDLLAGRDVLAHRALPCPGPLPDGWEARLTEMERRAERKQALFPDRAAPLPLAGVARLFGVSVPA